MMNISKRIKEDKGDAIIVLGILMIMVVLVIGAMLLDISKAFQMKSAYNDAAQKATQAAIMYTNSEGYLTAESIGETLRIYENVARPSTIKEGYMSFCPNESDERRVDIVITAMKDKDRFRPGKRYVVNSSKIRPSDTADDIIRRELGFGRVGSRERKNFEDAKYIGIEMELYESTPNVILPSAAVIAGDDDGQSYDCQILGVRAGASQYTGATGKYN